jgi:cell wall-associated NlpC family hydrolase
MALNVSRRTALAAISLGCLDSLTRKLGLAVAASPRSYQAGYHLAYTHEQEDLIGDLLNGPRGEPQRESETPHAEWYSHHVRRRYGAWGPDPRRYLPLEGLDQRSLAWQCERVIATAARFVGYEYQHHHIPDWNPPSHWPWKPCCAGHNGKGVDCSNFTSFVYNQGFGIHMNSGIGRQAELHSALEGHHTVRLRRIELPAGYAERQAKLQTGDLLYIRGREEGPITHVVIWVGSIGRSESGVPLILDSHGGDVLDDTGRPIPCGIHLRPFREDSWYNRCASHAHRVFE